MPEHCLTNSLSVLERFLTRRSGSIPRWRNGGLADVHANTHSLDEQAQTVVRRLLMLLIGMIVLGVGTFAAMVGFIAFCDRV
jgi:hypothetical protein